MMKLFYSLFFLFLMFCFFFNTSLSAQDTTTVIGGKIYIGYNEKPDSLYLNGKKIDLPEKNIIEVDTGKYNLEAYLSCYKPVSQTFQIRSKKVQPVRLKFEHLTTPEYDNYKYNNGNLQLYTSSFIYAPFYF